MIVMKAVWNISVPKQCSLLFNQVPYANHNNMVGTEINSVLLENLQLKFNNFVKKPEKYLKIQNEVSKDLKCFVKTLYDLTKATEGVRSVPSALDALVVEGLDEEQVWQQLELQNAVCTQFVQDVAGLVARKNKLCFPFPDKEGAHLEDTAPADSHDEEPEEDEEGGSKKVKKKKRRKTTVSEVDDKFFKLEEMEDFLKQQESGETSRDAEEDNKLIDYFQNVAYDSENGEGEQLHYADFFDRPDSEDEGSDRSDASKDGEDEVNGDGKKVRFTVPELQSEDPSEDENDKSESQADGPKSSLERRRVKLEAQISKLEEEALAEKPWQLKGEVTSATRPQNSLLEETVEFEMVTRPAPVRTEKTTLRLEDIVKLRIKDRAWDDVERKLRPVESVSEYKKRLVLDQEKSKISLAEVYEREYLQQKRALEPKDVDAPEEEPPENEQIRQAVTKLFRKLDALCNFHYTPMPAIPEVKIISNLPAITVEEVTPLATSDSMLLAPEEIKAKQKGELMAQTERDNTDKKRQRRWKKAAQRRRKKEKEGQEKLVEKLRPGLGNPYSKEKALRDVEAALKSGAIQKTEDRGRDKSVKSSTAFFNSLQEEVNNHIRVKKRSTDTGKERAISAKKLKL